MFTSCTVITFPFCVLTFADLNLVSSTIPLNGHLVFCIFAYLFLLFLKFSRTPHLTWSSLHLVPLMKFPMLLMRKYCTLELRVVALLSKAFPQKKDRFLSFPIDVLLNLSIAPVVGV